LDGPIFTTSTSCLIFFYLDLLMPFRPIFLLQNILDLQVYSLPYFAMKLSKPDSP
jgi:hypothetical protein